MGEVYFMIRPCMIFAFFSSSEGDCSCVHNFSITPSRFLSPAVLPPLTFPHQYFILLGNALW